MLLCCCVVLFYTVQCASNWWSIGTFKTIVKIQLRWRVTPDWRLAEQNVVVLCCFLLFIKIWSLDTALPGTASENLHDESAIIITRVAPPSPGLVAQLN